MLEQGFVRRRGGVVKLVDDDDVEVLRVDLPNIRRVQTLNRREDVLEARRPLATHPLLPEASVAEGVPEYLPALVEDLLAVGDKEQAAARQLWPKPRVVDGRHHGLARAGRR